MKAGRLRDRLTIQTYLDVENTYGETRRNWTDFATVYAEIRPVSGREFLANEKLQGEISHVITIRFLSGIKGKMRMTDGTRIFQIVAVIPDRKNNTMLTIMANQKAG